MHPSLLIVSCLPTHSVPRLEEVIRRQQILQRDFVEVQADGRSLMPFDRRFYLLTGDVLQLPVPVRRVDLLPGSGSAPEGLR